MGFAQHRPCRGNKNFIQERLPKGRKRDRQPRAASRPIMRCFGVMLRIDSRNALPSGQRGRITVPANHFGTMLAHLLSMLGAMFAHLEVMLGLCWPILSPCWTMLRARLGRRVPAEVIWGYVVFMTSPSVPKFCLKTLSPVACEAPTPFLQRYFSEKVNPAGDGHTPDERLKAPTSGLRGSRRRFPRGSEAPGAFPVAEATIQATTSLPLHGMAGFKGCRPVPPTPEVFIMGPEGVPR